MRINPVPSASCSSMLPIGPCVCVVCVYYVYKRAEMLKIQMSAFILVFTHCIETKRIFKVFNGTESSAYIFLEELRVHATDHVQCKHQSIRFEKRTADVRVDVILQDNTERFHSMLSACTFLKKQHKQQFHRYSLLNVYERSPAKWPPLHFCLLPSVCLA